VTDPINRQIPVTFFYEIVPAFKSLTNRDSMFTTI